VIRRFALAAFVLAAALAGGPAFAASPAGHSSSAPGPGSEGLSIWGILDPGPVNGLGFGARYTIPLVPEGVLHSPRVHDEFTLEAGADFVHYGDHVGYGPGAFDYSWNGLLPVVGATWNFWLTPKLALYPKLDLGYWIGWYSGWNAGYGYNRADYGGFFVQGAAGLIYRFQTVSLRVELGSGMMRAGVGFAF
jgi:hypothetical protein